MRRGEKNTHQPAAHDPAKAIQTAGRMPRAAPSAPPITPPSGIVPQTIQRVAAFIRPSRRGGHTVWR
ncbi:MAG: hypothetical protein JO345_06605 [Streptosporangiaceae bacterium]|nr:hypothetical protein [Streptosporangiaceae bacterium]